MKDRILIVAKEETFRNNLAEILEATGDYLTVTASSFEEAISEILLGDFALVVTETELPDLSGMDLLAVVGGLRPNAMVMIIDDDLTGKSAVAAIRLGACDYLHKPVNPQFLMMQIESHMQSRHATREAQPAKEKQTALTPLREREQLNPVMRPVARLVDREQFNLINRELQHLLGHIKARFVGLVDGDGNLAGAAGTLEGYDLVLLTRALSIDHSATGTLASLLDEQQFHSTYLEGEHNGVYIIEIQKPYTLSLAVICSVDTKPGMVWLYSKRTAESIVQILSAAPQSHKLASSAGESDKPTTRPAE